MRLRNDDQLHSVSDVFLGPPGWSLPWQARYRAYGVGFVLFLGALAFEQVVGLGVSLTAACYALLFTVGATTGLMRVVTFDRPLRSLVVTFWAELTAPRPPATVRQHLEPGRIRIEGRPRRFCGGVRARGGVRAPLEDRPNRPPEGSTKHHARELVDQARRAAERGGRLLRLRRLHG